MAGRFPTEWMDELRGRTDIVQVVSQYVPLKRSGGRYTGLCPFHKEKTPSFSVDPKAQLYYCFGCHAGGDVVRFTMDIEHITFPEAVEELAQKQNMPLPQETDKEEYRVRKTQRERLLAANREAAIYYNDKLFTPDGKPCLDYLKSRGVSDNMIRRFGLGASGSGGDQLKKHLISRGYTEEELILAGLCKVREAEPATVTSPAKSRWVYDMFRSRVMFPIIDRSGNVLGFGGRTLENVPPKYMNTSDTPVFNKRKGVYAANLLQKERHLDRVILVEGYMDVIALSQYGVKGVCATLGTALTNEQAKLLSHYASTVYLSYDGDSAGQHAILRGLEIFKQERITARVLDFPDGLDPDEFIRRDGLEGFQQLKVLTPEQYRLRRLKDECDMSTQEGRTKYAKGAAAIIQGLEPVEMENALRDIEVQTGFSRDVLVSQVDLERRNTASVEAAKPAYAQAVQKPAASKGDEGSENLRSQEVLVSVLSTGRLPGDIAVEDDFSDPLLRDMFVRLQSGKSAASIIGEYEDEEERARAARILFSAPEEQRDQLIQMAQDCLKKIRKKKIQDRMAEIAKKVNQLEGSEQMAAIREYSSLKQRLTELKP